MDDLIHQLSLQKKKTYILKGKFLTITNILGKIQTVMKYVVTAVQNSKKSLSDSLANELKNHAFT